MNLRPIIDLPRRRKLFTALLAGALSLTLMSRSACATTESSLPEEYALPDALSRALLRREPLLVMVSLHGCPFCKVVRENYLQPMQANGLNVVQVNMREEKEIIDFDGKIMTHDQWVRQRNVRIAPTVLFFGQNGQEVAARLKGSYLSDFYGAYLEEQLTQARRVVQKQ